MKFLRPNLQGYSGAQSSQLGAVPAEINSARVPHVCNSAIMGPWHKTRCTNRKIDWHPPAFSGLQMCRIRIAAGPSLEVILMIEAKPAACFVM